MKYLLLLCLCFSLQAQNNPSTNPVPTVMEAMRISTGPIVITNAYTNTLNQTVWPQGISVRPITGAFVDVSCPFSISNGSPYQPVIIGLKPTLTNTLIFDVGSASETVRPIIGSYGSQITTVVIWPQNPYWFELDFQLSQADSVTFFSTNIVSTNAPVAGTYTLKLAVTATNVTVTSQ